MLPIREGTIRICEKLKIYEARALFILILLNLIIQEQNRFYFLSKIRYNFLKANYIREILLRNT